MRAERISQAEWRSRTDAATLGDVYAPGDHIVIRDVWRGRVWDAVPVTVVRHDDHWLVDHQAVGSEAVARTCRGREKLDALEAGSWELAPFVVTEPGINFYIAGGRSRVGMAWSPDYTSFHGWYINLQQPLRSSRYGFDTMDCVLDVRIAPSGQWVWKDADDFAEAIHRKLFNAELRDILHRHVDDLLRIRDAQEGPFDPVWQRWRPPDGWTIPTLPEDAVTA